MKQLTESCTLCKRLSKGAQSPCMDGIGEVGAELLFVGEAPGEEDDVAGEPFVGRSGRYLRRNLFAEAGIDELDVYFTNACRCRLPGNLTPKKPELRNCRDRLVAEIKSVGPKVVVLLGNGPLTSLLYLDKVGGITKWRGKPLWSTDLGCWVVATFHPSAILHDKSQGVQYRRELMVNDLEFAVQLIGRKPPKQPLADWRLLETESELVTYLRGIVSQGVDRVAVDTETHLMRPTNDILGVSLCYRDGNRYRPVYFEWGVLEKSKAASSLFREILQSPDIRKVLHNVAFDHKFLHFHGFDIDGPVDDTMIMCHLLDENFSAGLKENTWRYLPFGGYDIGLDEYKHTQKFKKSTSYRNIPLSVLAPYAACDTLASLMLAEVLEPRLREEQLYPLYDKVLVPVRMVITGAEITGFKVDLERAKSLEVQCNAAKDLLLKRVYEFVGREFDVNSSKQLQKVLFEELGLKPVAKTKTGQPSTDAPALKLIAKQRKRGARVVADILRYKYLEKLRGTYIAPAESNAWDDGRVHSSFRMTGTVTGRASNADPCTHNIPKDRLVRSLYVASEGNLLVEADIKAAELRAVALYSGEQVFLDAFERGENIHKVTYRTIFGKPDDYEPTQDEYRLAKTINFGLIYGITPIGLAARTGLTETEAERFMRQYFERLPRIRDFMRGVVRDARKTGYVVSLFKRRRRLPDIQGDDVRLVRRCTRQAQNAPVQSAAADYTYIGLIRVANAIKKAGLRAKIVHTVHDCIVVDTPVAEVDAVKQIILTAFESPVKAFPIKMEVDVHVGKAWGEDGESNLEKLFSDVA